MRHYLIYDFSVLHRGIERIANMNAFRRRSPRPCPRPHEDGRPASGRRAQRMRRRLARQAASSTAMRWRLALEIAPVPCADDKLLVHMETALMEQLPQALAIVLGGA